MIGPNTIFHEIRELEPGQLLRIHSDGQIHDSEYWSLSPQPR